MKLHYINGKLQSDAPDYGLVNPYLQDEGKVGARLSNPYLIATDSFVELPTVYTDKVTVSTTEPNASTPALTRMGDVHIVTDTGTFAGSIQSIWIKTSNTSTDPNLWLSLPLKNSGSYKHTQTTPATTWVVSHNLDAYLPIVITDLTGNMLVATVTYTDSNTITVNLTTAASGYVYVHR